MEKEGPKPLPPSLDKKEIQLGQQSPRQPPTGLPLSPQSGETSESHPEQPLPVAAVAKKPQKVRTSKPKLPSLHESCKENEEAGADGNEQKMEDKSSEFGGGEGESTSRKAYFGVKSYLHQFYENRGVEAPGGCEEDYHYLIQPKGRTCGTILFKIGLITGATLFLLGAVAIVIGYAIPTQEEVRGQTDEFKILDRNAMRFNRNLDLCKLSGLAMFCCGGIVLVISLLAPTFTSSYWEEDLAPEAFRFPINLSPIPEDEPKSQIPVTEKITGIQPVWTYTQ